MTTRILSDLHYGHPATFVRDLRQLAPLLEGARRVVFNGDSVEMRFVRERERGAAHFAQLAAFCGEAGVEALFLTGNHDPALTALHHLDLAGGAVFVTHGDVFFHGLSPWSWEWRALREAHTRFLREAGREQAPEAVALEPQLAAARLAARAIETLGPRPHHAGRLRSLPDLAREVWPPWRPLRMIDCWLKAPARAAAFAARHRPGAKVFLVGHTHRAGIWKRGGCTVVNTGSFLPYSGVFAVDLLPGEVVVRKITTGNGGNGAFRLGREVARIGLD